MNGSKSPIHPDKVLEALLANTSNQQRSETLKRLHELCRAQASSAKDFSRATMSKFCTSSGAFNGRILYNPASAPLVKLIEAWELYCGSPVTARPKVAPAPREMDTYLERVSDPALRAIIHAKLLELERTRAEIRMLKSAPVVIDMRPTATVSGLANLPTLTPSEREALEHACSTAFMQGEGWKEGPQGEVVLDNGRKLYPVGYLRALRKVLAHVR